MKSTSLAVLAAVSLVPTLASAQLYNLQLNGHEASTYSGAAQIGGGGDVWNNPEWTGVTGAASTTLFSGVALLDSTGADNGVSVTMTALYNNNAGGWNTGVFNRYSGQTGGSATPGLMDLVVKSDYSGSVNEHTISISGLPANAAVTAYGYGAGTGAGQGSSWSIVGGTSADIDYDGSATGRDVTLVSSQGLSWNTFSGTTDGAGNLTVIAATGNGSVWWQTYLNGLQLDVVVPEPSAFALAGFGLLALFIRKRR